MEFKFRAVDHTPAPPPPPISFPTTVTYISHRSLRGGFSGMIPSPRHNSFLMPMNNANEALRRQLEKEQIRRELIAGVIERRRELEEEVKRELELEREWGMTMAATSHGFSFEERVSTMRLNPNPYLFGNIVQPQLPQLMLPAELKPSPETNNDKVIKLGSVKFPSPSLYRLDTNAWPQSQLQQRVAPVEEFKPSPETNSDKVVKLGSVKFSSPCKYRFDNNTWPRPQLAQLMDPVEEFNPFLETNNDKVVNLGSIKFPSPCHSRFDNNAWPLPQLPGLMATAEFKPSPETNKDKVIKLAKPDPDRYDAKRKAVAPPDVDGSNHFPAGLKKKPKEEWSCAVCQVSATSEKGLKDHLQGRKHKAKEIALRKHLANKGVVRSNNKEQLVWKNVKSNEPYDTASLGLDAKTDKLSLQPNFMTRGHITKTMASKGAVESKNEEQLVQENQNIDGLKNENGTANEQGGMNALKRRRMKFWCEACQVGAFSQVVMESHKKGKKHLARMKTSSQLVEAPGLIKDTDAGNKGTIIKMVKQFS